MYIVFKLKYISAGPLETPELSVEQAFNEIIHFAHISKNGMLYAKEALNESDTEKFELLKGKLEKYEEISDRIEIEIATFLNSVSVGEISETTTLKIKAMYKIIGEMESLGDSVKTIGCVLLRKNDHNKVFEKDYVEKLNIMADAVLSAYNVMIENLIAAHKGELKNISNAYNSENKINSLRNSYIDAVIEDIDNGGKSYQTSVFYMDIINALEHMGDFMINISEDLGRSFIQK